MNAYDKRFYDVCFVGSVTPRRFVIAQKLISRGLLVSPFTGVFIDDIALNSKILLNVHAFRSNNFELPRILSGICNGAAVVTEPSHVENYLLPSTCFSEFHYHDIVEGVVSTLNHSVWESQTRQAYAWYRESYYHTVSENWRDLATYFNL